MKKFLFALTLGLSAITSQVMAIESIDTLKDKLDNNYAAELIKKDGFYYMKLSSLTTFDSYGNRISNGEHRTRYLLNKKITIPVSITRIKKSGLDLNYQIGLLDNDEVTGNFSSKGIKQVKNLFGTYKGSAKNIGIAVVGVGYTYAYNNDIKLSEVTGTAIIPAGGAPVGFSFGPQFYNFSFKLSTIMKAAEAEYQLTLIGDDRDSFKKSEVVGLDEVFEAELSNN